jgi:hypothetical protein
LPIFRATPQTNRGAHVTASRLFTSAAQCHKRWRREAQSPLPHTDSEDIRRPTAPRQPPAVRTVSSPARIKSDIRTATSGFGITAIGDIYWIWVSTFETRPCSQNWIKCTVTHRVYRWC